MVDFSLEGKKIFVAGHNGMVGNSVLKKLTKIDCEILTVDKSTCDLTNQKEVNEWMKTFQPNGVIICAAKVGGIAANNSSPVNFLQDNLMIQTNLIKSSFDNNVSKLLFLGSSCIYPRNASQPIKEEFLLNGYLEPTNEWYAVAKIAGIKLCQAYRKQFKKNFISVMPTNLYGPGDNYDLKESHVIPAILHKTHLAKEKKEDYVEIWGSGKPLREFLYVEDCADGILFLMKHYSNIEHINLGSGEETSIKDLTKLIFKTVGYNGEMKFNSDKPDGTMRKLLDISKLNSYGWKSRTSLKEGLEFTFEDFKKNYSVIKK